MHISTISSKILYIYIYAYTCSYIQIIFLEKKMTNPSYPCHTHNVFFVAQRLAERFFVQKKHRFDQVEVPEPILEFCRPTVLVMTCLGRVLRIFRVWIFSLGYFFGVFSYRSGWFFTCLEQVGAPNSTYRGYNSSYPFIRLFLGVILPFITSGGPH